jgi:hypothetical protein
MRYFMLALLFVLASLIPAVAFSESTRPAVRDASVCPTGEILVLGLWPLLVLLPDDVVDVEVEYGRPLSQVLEELEWTFVDEDGVPVGGLKGNREVPCLVEAADA